MSRPSGVAGPGADRRLSSTVLWLGAVSFLTDAAGELIFPLLPIFLTTVLHASLGQLGLIEGAAESTAALVKFASGRLSDRLTRRKPLVLFGYALAAAARPLLALAQGPLAVLAIRLGDRVGKGVRGSPRDALLADATPSHLRGKAYGWHQAMDNAGAVLGPLLGFGLLSLGMGLRQVFLVAAIPGALAVLTVLLFVRETPRQVGNLARPAPGAQADPVAAPLPPALRRYFLALAVFSLGNSSDAFLLVWARDAGLPAGQVPLLWMLHNGVKALLNTPLGSLSDRWGRRRLILASWTLYALVYLGFATLTGTRAAWGLMVAYGGYYALLEGSEKAMVADLAPAAARGRAFGWFNGIIGLCALPASLLCSFLYESGRASHTGPLRAFGAGAALAGLAALIARTVPEPRPRLVP